MAAVGIVIRMPDQSARVLRRAVRAGSRAEAAYRALLLGLWRAKAAGTRRVQAYADEAAVVDQLAGRAEVPPELTGVYLQTRALLNAFRWSAVELLPRERNVEAAVAALEALDAPVAEESEFEVAEPMPLWAVTEKVTT